MKRAFKWLAIALLAVATGFLLRTYVFRIVRVAGTSMQEALVSGDFALATALDASTRNGPDRGDVMLCRFPNSQDVCIKRVIGLPGERVEIVQGVVYINGCMLEEAYAVPDSSNASITLGKDEYFVLGDNRIQSYDSRQADVGPLKKTDFRGKIQMVVWPIGRIHAVNAGKGEICAMENNDNRTPQETLSENENKAPEKAQKPAKPKKGFWREVREWIVSLAVALLVVFVIRTFFFTIIRVDGGSMEHTLENNERLFVTVLDVRLGNIDRNDVVICHYPDRYTKYLGGLITTKTYFVKRVVAVPGDCVYRENGVTYVKYTDENGETILEALDEKKASAYSRDPDYGEYVLGEDEYFVVGDNRYNSHDSRDWNDNDPSRDVGPITEDMIVGHVRNVIWPLNAIRKVE